MLGEVLTLKILDLSTQYLIFSLSVEFECQILTLPSKMSSLCRIGNFSSYLLHTFPRIQNTIRVCLETFKKKRCQYMPISKADLINIF